MAERGRRGRRLASVAIAALLLTAPLAAVAQDAGRVWRIGFLSPYSVEMDKPRLDPLRQALRALGYTEGKHFVVTQRHAEGRFEKLPALAAELVRLPVDILIAHGDAGGPAGQATATIPVVMVASPDPVGLGIVPSLARPGGNVTGLSDLHGDLVAKRLTLVKEALPLATRVGVLWRSKAPAHPPQLKDLQAAAPALRLTVVPIEVAGPEDFDRVFSTMKKERLDALNILGGAAGVHRRRLADLAIQHRVPTISTTREFAQEGPAAYRRTGQVSMAS